MAKHRILSAVGGAGLIILSLFPWYTITNLFIFMNTGQTYVPVSGFQRTEGIVLIALGALFMVLALREKRPQTSLAAGSR
jgi:hypothetical protein